MRSGVPLSAQPHTRTFCPECPCLAVALLAFTFGAKVGQEVDDFDNCIVCALEAAIWLDFVYQVSGMSQDVCKIIGHSPLKIRDIPLHVIFTQACHESAIELQRQRQVVLRPPTMLIYCTSPPSCIHISFHNTHIISQHTSRSSSINAANHDSKFLRSSYSSPPQHHSPPTLISPCISKRSLQIKIYTSDTTKPA